MGRLLARLEIRLGSREESRFLSCKSTLEYKAAENLGHFRRRHLLWFTAASAVWSRLLRQRRSVPDSDRVVPKNAGQSMAILAEGNIVATARVIAPAAPPLNARVLEREYFIGSHRLPDGDHRARMDAASKDDGIGGR